MFQRSITISGCSIKLQEPRSSATAQR